MSLDHGLLNLPLAKRMGDIDSQIDKYKREKWKQEQRARKANAAEHKTLKAQARVALAELDGCPGLLEAKAAKLNLTRKQLYGALLDWAKWQPARVVKAQAEWMGEAQQPR